MMGGFGSGRPYSSHIGVVEGFPAIDVNRLHRIGYLRSGWQAPLKWICDGQEIGPLNNYRLTPVGS